MINQVLEAEKSANDQEISEKNKAADIIKAAETEAKSIFESAKISATKEKEKIILKAQKNAENILANAEAEAEAQSKEICEQSQSKLEASIEAVIKHVIP